MPYLAGGLVGGGAAFLMISLGPLLGLLVIGAGALGAFVSGVLTGRLDVRGGILALLRAPRDS